MDNFIEDDFKLPSGTIHYKLRAKSDPLLVFIYGGMGQIDQGTWNNIINLLPRDLSILTFDRPGIGKSKKSEFPRNAENIASELKSLLDTLNFSKYVLIGHSLGGLYARYFASRFPEKVKSLVLLDSTHEDQLERGKKYYDPQIMKESQKSSSNNPEGLMIPGDPEASFSQMRRFKSLPGNIKSVIAVAEKSLPSQVPDADKLNELNIILHRELSETSRNSYFYIIKDSSHFIYIDQPGKIIDMILSVL